MPEDTMLGDQLRQAFRSTGQAPVGGPAIRDHILTELHRRSTKRRRLGAALGVGLAAVSAAVPLAILGLTTTSTGPFEALGQTHERTTPGASACGLVQVDGGSPACAGTLSVGTSASASGAVSTGRPSSAFAGPSQRAPQYSTQSRELTVRVGQTFSVELPGITGLRWSTPAASPGLRLEHMSPRHPSGAVSATFVARSQGVAVIQATTTSDCPGQEAATCSLSGTWNAVVTVNN